MLYEVITRQWYQYDAEGNILGRLAVEVTKKLMGKEKVTFTPHIDGGDFVITSYSIHYTKLYETTSVRTLESSVDSDGKVLAGKSDTEIFIYPGYKFKVLDALITNFHLPKSTLLMLISAFAGKDFVFEAYERAVKEKYRFFSFGDSMFIY